MWLFHSISKQIFVWINFLVDLFFIAWLYIIWFSITFYRLTSNLSACAMNFTDKIFCDNLCNFKVWRCYHARKVMLMSPFVIGISQLWSMPSAYSCKVSSLVSTYFEVWFHKCFWLITWRIFRQRKKELSKIRLIFNHNKSRQEVMGRW